LRCKYKWLNFLINFMCDYFTFVFVFHKSNYKKLPLFFNKKEKTYKTIVQRDFILMVVSDHLYGFIDGLF